MPATIEDLYKVEEKAEIVCGEIEYLMATGGGAGYAEDALLVSLFHYARRRRIGRAVGDGKGFHVNLPNRESFSPDAAILHWSQSAGMGFYDWIANFRGRDRETCKRLRPAS